MSIYYMCVYIYIYEESYYKELAYAVTEAANS